MALTLSVGFVVDDAIVMLENIVRHMEMGKPRLQAALDGSKEIAFTIVSMTLSLAAVFIPVFFMGGILGRLLHEFAVTIIVAVLISGFVSLTLTPLLCSRMLKITHAEDHGRLYNLSERAFNGILGLYRGSLAWVLHHRRFTMGVFAAIFAGTGFFFYYMPKGFLPSDDVGQLFVITEAAQDISFQAMTNLQQQVAAIVQRNPHVESVMSFAGAGGPSSSLNNGRIFVALKPRDERPSADAVIQELRPTLTGVPASARSCRTFPRSASAGASPRASTSTRCRRPTPARCTNGRRGSRRRCAASRASST
jgi:HAE1 family hydrophobic/amphiphilic exporter-1